MLTEHDSLQLQRQQQNAKCRPKGIKWFEKGVGRPLEPTLNLLADVDQRGYMQADIARRMGVSQQWVSKILQKARAWVEKHGDAGPHTV